MTFDRGAILLLLVGLLIPGCERIEGLWETEPDDSAKGMSGVWDIESSRTTRGDCTTLEHASPQAATVQVEILSADMARSNDASADVGTSVQKRLDVMMCGSHGCEPVGGPYSQFDKAAFGWALEVLEADGSAHPDCTASRVTATFVPLPEQKARLEVQVSRGEWVVEGNESCTDELVEDRVDGMSCIRRRVLELRRPADASS